MITKSKIKKICCTFLACAMAVAFVPSSAEAATKSTKTTINASKLKTIKKGKTVTVKAAGKNIKVKLLGSSVKGGQKDYKNYTQLVTVKYRITLPEGMWLCGEDDEESDYKPVMSYKSTDNAPAWLYSIVNVESPNSAVKKPKSEKSLGKYSNFTYYNDTPSDEDDWEDEEGSAMIEDTEEDIDPEAEEEADEEETPELQKSVKSFDITIQFLKKKTEHYVVGVIGANKVYEVYSEMPVQYKKGSSLTWFYKKANKKYSVFKKI